jgi:hypothetical protein
MERVLPRVDAHGAEISVPEQRTERHLAGV